MTTKSRRDHARDCNGPWQGLRRSQSSGHQAVVGGGPGCCCVTLTVTTCVLTIGPSVVFGGAPVNPMLAPAEQAAATPSEAVPHTTADGKLTLRYGLRNAGAVLQTEQFRTGAMPQTCRQHDWLWRHQPVPHERAAETADVTA